MNAVRTVKVLDVLLLHIYFSSRYFIVAYVPVCKSAMAIAAYFTNTRDRTRVLQKADSADVAWMGYKFRGELYGLLVVINYGVSVQCTF